MAVLEVWRGLSVARLAARWGVPLLEVHDRLGSTQDRARALAGEGRAPWTVVLAEEQTAGRGRAGAPWCSGAGDGVWMSVLLPPGSGPHLSLVVGLAVAEAVERVVPETGRCGIEWPNDVTIHDRKVAGVLLEGSATGIVAGIGVNTCAPREGFPPELADRAASLDAWSAGSVDHPTLAGEMLSALRLRMAGARPRPDAALLEALRARDTLVGREVRTQQEGPGRAVGLADDGALLLERPDGRRVAVRSGHVRAAGPPPGRVSGSARTGAPARRSGDA